MTRADWERARAELRAETLELKAARAWCESVIAMLDAERAWRELEAAILAMDAKPTWEEVQRSARYHSKLVDGDVSREQIEALDKVFQQVINAPPAVRNKPAQKLTATAAKIRRLIEKGVLPPTPTINQAAEATGFSRATVYRALKRGRSK